jgi:hypothetical protein
MAAWIAPAISAIGSVAGGLLSMGGARESSANALQAAMLNYQLQKRIADQNYEIATAGKEDARGNKIVYEPGVGWKQYLTPASRSLVNQSDAIQRQQHTDWLGRGQDERRNAFNRRIIEGLTASPLLDEIRYQYGAPSREGVVGADKIAGVTAASENAENARSGFASAALRSGQGFVPLGRTLQDGDKGAVTGIRTALAKSDANASPLFESMRNNWMQGRLNPYNTLATRASNIENMPFNPEGITGPLDTSMMHSANAGVSGMSRAGLGLGSAANPLIAAMGQQPNWGSFVGGINNNIKELMHEIFKERERPGDKSAAYAARPVF